MVTAIPSGQWEIGGLADILQASRAGRVPPDSHKAEEAVPGVVLDLNRTPESSQDGTYSKRDILSKSEDASGLTDDEKKQIRELEARDREVRQHEQTHAALLGPYAVGGPTYSYQIGPDGKAYAIGGSIGVDTGGEATPEQTTAKARILKAAATSVGEASSADLAVAAKASQMEARAQSRIGK